MRIDVNGVGIEVDDQGDGPAVLLIHGWPDTHHMWRHQVPALHAAGFRTIAPDLRGFGASDKPQAVDDYQLPFLVGDLLGVLDHCGVEKAHIVGHDWGAALAWGIGSLVPDRALTVTAMSVGFPSAFLDAGLPQREKSWYMLLFQFRDVAEQWLQQNDWANFREWSRHPDAQEVTTRLADVDLLSRTLNLYRAVVPPESLVGEPLALPPVAAPTMGIWSSNDMALLEEGMEGSGKYVTGPWRYERIDGVGHWMTLEAPDRVNELLVDFLSAHRD